MCRPKEAPALCTFVLALWGGYMGDSGAQAFAGLKEAPALRTLFLGGFVVPNMQRQSVQCKHGLGGILCACWLKFARFSWGLSEAVLVLFVFQIYIVCMVFVFAATYFRASYMSWLWMCCVVSLTFQGRGHAAICAVDYGMHCSKGILAFQYST